MDELLSLFDDGDTTATTHQKQQDHHQIIKTQSKSSASEKSPSTKIRKDAATCSHSGIRITKRIVNSENLNDFIEPFTYKSPVAIAAMPKNELEGYDQELCTIGILVKKCGTRMTKTGASFCILELGSFLNKGIGTILTVFLFGEAYSKFVSKANLQEGSLVTLLGPSILPPKPGGKTNVSLSIRDGDRLVHIGTAQDYGVCHGKTFRGLKCKEAIDLRRGCYCSVHAKQALANTASTCSAIRKQPARVGSAAAGNNANANMKRNQQLQQSRPASRVHQMKLSHTSSSSSAANHWLAKQMEHVNRNPRAESSSLSTTSKRHAIVHNPYAKSSSKSNNNVKGSTAAAAAEVDNVFSSIEFPAAPPGYRASNGNSSMNLKNAPKHMNASSRDRFAKKSSNDSNQSSLSCTNDDHLGNMLGRGGRRKSLSSSSSDQSRRGGGVNNNKRAGPGSLSMYTKSSANNNQPTTRRDFNDRTISNNNKKARASLSTICGGLDGQVFVPQPSRVLFGVSSAATKTAAPANNTTTSTNNNGAASTCNLSQSRAEELMEKQRALAEALQKRKRGGKVTPDNTVRNSTPLQKSSSPRSIADALFDGMDVPGSANETLSATSKFASEAEAEQYASSRLIVTELEKKEMLSDMRKSKKQEANHPTGLKTQWFCATCNSRTSFKPRDCVRARHPIRRERSIIRAPEKDSAAAKKTKIAKDRSLTLGSGLEWSGYRGI